MTGDRRHSKLIDLPWEVRRPIIVEVLRHQRKSTPSLSYKFMESRVRLHNCFDEHFPEVTNFYVARHKNRYLHGNGLRATNRQLRFETNLLIQEELESGNIDLPFILDIMVVKDIGVFPTWISFPYRPERIKKLTINIRIVRLGTNAVPDEWVETARYYDDEQYSRWENSPTKWNVFVMAVILYAFGCFSVKQDPTQPLIQRNNKQPLTAQDKPSTQKQTIGNSKASSKQPSKPKSRWKSAMRLNLIAHQSNTLDAYILPSPSYLIDELFIDFKGCEYDAQSKPIRASDKDSSSKESRFYKEGCVQFSREVSRDFNAHDPNTDYEVLEDEQDLISQGKFACYQLQESLCNLLRALRWPEVRHSVYGLYLQMLARSTGYVSYSPCRGQGWSLIERHPSSWIEVGYVLTAQLDPEGYSNATIERDLAREIASAFTNEDLINDLRLLQIRRSHGWVREDD